MSQTFSGAETLAAPLPQTAFLHYADNITRPLSVATRIDSAAYSFEQHDRQASCASHGPAYSLSSQAPLRNDSLAGQSSPISKHEKSRSSSAGTFQAHGLSNPADLEKQSPLPSRAYNCPSFTSQRWIVGSGSAASLQDDFEVEPLRSCSLSAFVQLCSIAPFLALLTTVLAFLTVFYVTVTHPMILILRNFPSICNTTTTLHSRLNSLLIAPLRLHLHLIGAPIPPSLATSKSADFNQSRQLSVIRALFIHTFNPLVAMVLASAGWIVLLFWATSAIVADEEDCEYASSEKRRVDDSGGGDGKRAASSVAGVWVRFEGWGVLWGRSIMR